MSLFDYRNETFTPPPCDQLVCGICYSVCYNPVECPCQHMFCEDCIVQWLSDHGNCPKCRGTTLRHSLKTASRVIRNIILTLKIQCENRRRGCQEISSVERYEAHVRTCPYQLIVCPNGNCGMEIMLKDKSRHEETECIFYLTVCPVCKASLARHKMLDHDCFGELKFELWFAKEQLRELRDEKNGLQAQVEDLSKKQAEMLEGLTQARLELQELRNRKCGKQKDACDAMRVMQSNVEMVRNVVGTMRDVLKFSESRLNGMSVFLKY